MTISYSMQTIELKKGTGLLEKCGFCEIQLYFIKITVQFKNRFEDDCLLNDTDVFYECIDVNQI